MITFLKTHWFGLTMILILSFAFYLIYKTIKGAITDFSSGVKLAIDLPSKTFSAIWKNVKSVFSYSSTDKTNSNELPSTGIGDSTNPYSSQNHTTFNPNNYFTF